MAEIKKFLDLEGVSTLWNEVKAKLAEKADNDDLTALTTEVGEIDSRVEAVEESLEGVVLTDIATNKAAIEGLNTTVAGKADTSKVTEVSEALEALKNGAVKTNTEAIATINNKLEDVDLTQIEKNKTSIESLQTTKANKSDVESALADKADNTSLNALDVRVTKNEGAIEKLTGGKEVRDSVAWQIAEAVTSLINDAPTDFDTLGEIADWITNDTTGAAQMANDIKDLKELVGTYPGDPENDTIVEWLEALEASIAAITGSGSGSIGDLQKSVESLESLVGKIPDGATSENIVDYITELILEKAATQALTASEIKAVLT